MSLIATIATASLGGFVGSALTFGLTWRRENRRTQDSYRAPQREAIAGIVAASHRLVVSEMAFRRIMNDLASEARGELRRDYSQAELDADADQMNRVLLDLDTAFAIGRLTIVDPECFEAMGIAANELMKIQSEFANVAEVARTLENADAATQTFKDYVRQLKLHVYDLTKEGQAHLSPVQTWRHKRRREEARARLDAKYFKPKEIKNGPDHPSDEDGRGRGE